MPTQTPVKKEKKVKAVTKATPRKVAEKTKAKTKKVIFSYFAPEAKEVFILGTFNQWREKDLTLKKDAQGYWKCSVALEEGRYEYRYLVDSGWANDQEQLECVPNSYGSWNSVVRVQI